MKTVPTENCDVLMTFPGTRHSRPFPRRVCKPWARGAGATGPRVPADTTDDHTLLWLLNHIRVGIPELIVQVRHHRHTRAYAFFVTATYERRVPAPGPAPASRPAPPRAGLSRLPCPLQPPARGRRAGSAQGREGRVWRGHPRLLVRRGLHL
jgi:hypothetical protein